MIIPSFRPEQKTRREFCTQALWVAALAAIAEACGGSPTSPSSGSAPAIPTTSGSIAGNALVVNVDASSPLGSIGSAALIENSAGKFLIAHTATDTFAAVTAVCTHEACTINGYSNQIYVCPCHGSQFNTVGGVVKGPATQALRRYSTQLANNTLTIAL